MRVMQKSLGTRGQAMVEYILMTLVALALVALIGTSLRQTVIKLWEFYIQQISAACPGCKKNSKYKFH
jgi:Flp pilus assembly pilin Flp